MRAAIILLVFTSLGVNNVKSEGKMCCDCAVVQKGFTTNVRATVKKMEVDLTLKKSSQLQSGFFQVQGVVHLILLIGVACEWCTYLSLCTRLKSFK